MRRKRTFDGLCQLLRRWSDKLFIDATLDKAKINIDKVPENERVMGVYGLLDASGYNPRWDGPTKLVVELDDA